MANCKICGIETKGDDVYCAECGSEILHAEKIRSTLLSEISKNPKNEYGNLYLAMSEEGQLGIAYLIVWMIVRIKQIGIAKHGHPAQIGPIGALELFVKLIKKGAI